MDNSSEFQAMLTDSILNEPQSFVGFDRTKNVQDQLQEMLYGRVYHTKLPKGIKLEEKTDFISVFPTLLKFAYKWISDKDSATLTYSQPFTSMEQLWLAFVLKEKFNKAWDGDKWITGD